MEVLPLSVPDDFIRSRLLQFSRVPICKNLELNPEFVFTDFCKTGRFCELETPLVREKVGGLIERLTLGSDVRQAETGGFGW